MHDDKVAARSAPSGKSFRRSRRARSFPRDPVPAVLAPAKGDGRTNGDAAESGVARGEVRAWTGELVLPTWLPAPPDKNPMFLEKRVYQGSSGRVYPLPFTDRISEKPVDRKWTAVWIENEYLRVLVLPEIGGRIHAIQDKTNGYDLIYNQHVIKPALVGLAGPWISGGIEFNWPQHHRPATFLPVDFEIEEHPDGSKTIWCSDHDPMARMKGMHGVCLHPGKACLELKVRAYNRTPLVQTFLWWANVATRVHEAYQSFFPPDVDSVADHARRSVSEYPLAKGFYYGVNYGERARSGVPDAEKPAQYVPPHCARPELNGSQQRAPRTSGSDLSRPAMVGAVAVPGNGHAPQNTPEYAPNDLSFYANIPTPCSYMCMGSKQDFFGGYDHALEAGVVHVANHHISPGKKQWTWGNHEFGYAWDRNLTEPDGRGEFAPYIEIMAGVYTDNQPDFSFLQPGETKTWSQYWYPIQKIGPAQQANVNGAISLRRSKGRMRLGVAVTETFCAAEIRVSGKGKRILSVKRGLAPGVPFVTEFTLPRGLKEIDLCVSVKNEGKELLTYEPQRRFTGAVPPPATEPPSPEKIPSADELYITGLHLEQYRHATRCPTLYWREALRRDPADARCNNALGLWHLRRGEFVQAEAHFCKAIERLTRRNGNPSDGEPYYNLGLCLRHLGREQEAYAALYKATWNQAWAGAAYHALAELDCTGKQWATALDHLNRSLRLDADNLRARNLKVLMLRKLDRHQEARELLQQTRSLDRLDWWARHLEAVGSVPSSTQVFQGASHGPAASARQPYLVQRCLEESYCDLQVRLDLAHDYARAGFYDDAIDLLSAPAPAQGDLLDQNWGTWPIVCYTLGWLEQKRGDHRAASAHFRKVAKLPLDYCFPARLEEIAILASAMQANPADAHAPYLLGNLLYDRRRHEEALRLWECSAKLNPRLSVVWRNLGIGYFNVRHDAAKARAAYDRAFRVNPSDARLLYERDQLWKRLGENPANRLRELEKRMDLVRRRDDLAIELCALYNQLGRHEQALALVSSRHFQPWEGGEGGPLGQHVRSRLALGRTALAAGDATQAREHFEAALTAPINLGEARHVLVNQSDVHYWLGCALAELGETSAAMEQWTRAANFKGDFQEMSVRAFSEMTYYSALSAERLGRRAEARKLFGELLAYARQLETTKAKVDYFATSLPTMLLFEDDLRLRQKTTALFLQAQAQLGLGKRAQARRLLNIVLKRDPNHGLAADLLAEYR